MVTSALKTVSNCDQRSSKAELRQLDLQAGRGDRGAVSTAAHDQAVDEIIRKPDANVAAPCCGAVLAPLRATPATLDVDGAVVLEAQG